MKNIISWFIFAPWALRFSLLVFTVSVWVQSVMWLSLWMLHSSLWGANVYRAKQSYSSPYFYTVLEIRSEYTVTYVLEAGAFWKFSSSAHIHTCRLLSPWTLRPSAVARSCTQLQHKATSSTCTLIVFGKWECPALFFLYHFRSAAASFSCPSIASALLTLVLPPQLPTPARYPPFFLCVFKDCTSPAVFNKMEK